ncbi:MAG: polyketide synthase docking domain-containing protein [Lachnospiraceae bacterium]
MEVKKLRNYLRRTTKQNQR